MLNLKKQKTKENQAWRYREKSGGCQGQEVKGWVKQVKSEKVYTSSYTLNKSWWYKYSMVTMANNTVLNIWKLLREQTLEVLITRKKVCNYGEEC